jgi:hypothetical protein
MDAKSAAQERFAFARDGLIEDAPGVSVIVVKH